MGIQWKKKKNCWYMKRPLLKLIAADSDCMNIPLNDSKDKKKFVNKPTAVTSHKMKTPYHGDCKSYPETKGCHKHFGEDLIECFVNEILELETYMEHF